MTATILIVDDNPEQLRMAEYAVGQRLRYHAVTAGSGEEAIARVRSGRQPQPDLLLLDLMTPGAGGVQVIEAVQACRPQLPIIVFTRYGEDNQAVQALYAGASDFLTKPVALDRLRLSIRNILKLNHMTRYVGYLEHRQVGRVGFADIVGGNPALTLAVAAAKASAASPLPVWIRGEPGTGKELLARAMHGNGRAGKPFIAVDGATLEREASEPGMPQEKLAECLRDAENGTLYLRDIGAAPLPLQQWLLAVMAAKPGARLVFSSASGAEALMAQGRLDHGIYRCVRDAAIAMPPLRDRRQDIPLLARHFVGRYAASERKNIYGLTPDAIRYLTDAPWPGNVRQLAGLLWRAVMMCNQELLDAGNIRLIQQWQPAHYQPDIDGVGVPALIDGQGRIKKLRLIEEDAIRLALRHAGGSMTRAAKSLGIGRSTLYRRVQELEIGGYISRANQATRPMMEISSMPRS
ncbi:MAG: sigma-54-dependent Fis family transcriptional regulator [Pseudomonadota bacterium]|nr:sigma-54-dependent Fis family transcriptional regulator [Pseudomonadota bacterium]MDE3037764.1 sigma-54-dependent Fis family transcriptional regulator [Pseudomonadota bacterium]